MATPAPAYAPPAPGNGIAIAAMVCGIIGLIAFMIPIVWIASLLGIIFGAIGIAKAKRVGKGKGMAIAGLVCGVLGIVIGLLFYVVFIPASLDYMSKGKKTESSVQLNQIDRKIKRYYIENSRLPPSSGAPLPGAPGSQCGTATDKLQRVPASKWAADPAWGAIGFQIDEDTLYAYQWIKTSEKSGKALAIGDLDCDTTLTTTEVDIAVVDGNPVATYLDPTPD